MRKYEGISRINPTVENIDNRIEKRGKSRFTLFAFYRVGAAACYHRVISMEARGAFSSSDMAKRKRGFLVKGVAAKERVYMGGPGPKGGFQFSAAETWPLPRATGVLVRASNDDTHPVSLGSLFFARDYNLTLVTAFTTFLAFLFCRICIYCPSAAFNARPSFPLG